MEYESPLDRARQKTEEAIRKGYVLPWVLDRENGEATRDRLNAAKDRRAGFRLIDGGKPSNRSPEYGAGDGSLC